MHLYPDLVLVDEKLFRDALGGDIMARRRLAFSLNNAYASEHIEKDIAPGEIAVSLRDLTEAGVLDGVILKVRDALLVMR